ncbi:MAG: DUF4012 domain-containing protein [Chloroflexi bacterium]|nr:DUF4012 domain-containing protein [Chloroflexota bacterium]
MSTPRHTLSLETPPPGRAPAPAARAGRGRRRRALLFLGLTLALLLGGWAAATGYAAARHGRSLLRTVGDLQAVARGAAPASNEDLVALLDRAPQVAGLLEAAARDLRALDDLTAPLHPIARRLGWLPGYGPEVAAAPHLLRLARAEVEAAQYTVTALQGLPAVLQDGGLAGITSLLRQAQPDLLAAEAALQRAQQERSAFRGERLRHPLVTRLVAQSDAALPPLLAGVRAALVLPDLLGDDEPQTYLILGQNNDELRATGGFIGTAGLLTITKGEITAFDYRDSYQFDASEPRPLVTPPRPYVNYLLIPDWRFRDANWWADFPTSARKLEEFLQHDQGQRVAGVIALDQTALRRIMEHLGPVEVPDFGERVDAANLLDLLDRYAHPSGYKEGYEAPDPPKVTGPDRKAFLGALARVLLTRVQHLEGAAAAPLLQTMRRLLEEKHLLVFLHHPEAADLLREHGWDGALPPVEGDTLLVAETNVGYSKANRFVQQRLDYHVTLLDDLSVGRSSLTITYRNTNTAPARHCDAAVIDFFTADDSCYKSYVRVYVPPGSVLLGMSGIEGSPEWLTEGARTVFAGLLVLPPGETRQVTVSYVPPRGVVAHTATGVRYRLRAFKQPGTEAVPLTVTVAPPAGYRPASGADSTPPAEAAHRATDLSRDRDLTIELQRTP